MLHSLNGLDGNSASVTWGGTDRLFWPNNIGGDSRFAHLRNNVIIFEGGGTGHSSSPASDSDYNIIMDAAQNERDIYGDNGSRKTTIAQLGFVNYGSDFTPAAGSPLRGAAGPLPSVWNAPDVPGFSKADVGAFQSANPQPGNWPRVHSRTQKHFSPTVPDRW